MIISLSGVTGSGKSYFKKMIQEKLDLSNQVIYTTRSIRKNEVNGIDKIFVSDEEFDMLEEQGKIIVTFEYLEHRYGYDANEIKSDNTSIIELHYSIIYRLKQQVDKKFAIYIIPNDINTAKEKLRLRNLDKKQEELRLKEIDEQAEKFNNNKELREQFDYVFYNNYDEESTNKLIDVIRNKLNI